MSRGVRLPTLYPMPRDIGQYRVCYAASLDEPMEQVYAQRLRGDLRKEDGGEYSPSMIERLLSNVVRTGFVRKESGIILPPDRTWRRWNGNWDQSEEEFPKYVEETLLKWGNLFPSGLVLAYDILSQVDSDAMTASQIMTVLTRDDQTSGKYDGRDQYANRTIRELLKLTEFACWVEREGRQYRLTHKGRRRRTELRKRDPYYMVERILTTVDPVATKIFTPEQKIELSKHYMYRQCGGKYRSTAIRMAHDIIFDHPYHKSLKPTIAEELEKEGAKCDALKAEIQDLHSDFAEPVENLRSRTKLKAIRDALQGGRITRAWEIIQESGGHFSWESVRQLKHGGPDYTITPVVAPYQWQDAALEAWKSAGRRGVLEVVTGAGKTVFALIAIAELLQEESDTRITVIVPTKVLMYQWATELVRVLGVPPQEIGFRGDGHKDSFEAGKQVMITIINSAVLNNYLVRDTKNLPDNVNHLLIADECHRYRGEQFRQAFEARFEYGLGLSATPVDPDMRRFSQRHDEVKDIILQSLGEVFFEYSYSEALRDGIIQRFIVKYVGVDLTAEERRVYDAYTKQIGKCLNRIRGRYGPRLEAMSGPLFARLHSILNTDENPDPAIRRYFTAVRERKDLVFAARNRKWAYLDIMHTHTAGKKNGEPEDKIIVFQERIENLEEVVAPTDYRRIVEGEMDDGDFRGLGVRDDEQEREISAKYRSDPVEKKVDQNLEALLFEPAFKPVMYHSGHSRPAWNEIGMEWFRGNIANVMLSVKALVEGVDVPAANIGVIRASSSSVRQRIQTTGRILRRTAGKDRPAVLYVIYARDTTDERIFRGVDWSEQLGDSAIESYHWRAPEDSESVHGTWTDRRGELPNVPEYGEEDEVEEFEVEELDPGDPYPGKYAGWEYHVDAKGRPFKKTREGRRLIENVDVREAARRIFEWKRGGKFVITPESHIVTKLENGKLVFVGILEGEVEIEDAPQSRSRRKLSGDPPTFEELFG